MKFDMGLTQPKYAFAMDVLRGLGLMTTRTLNVVDHEATIKALDVQAFYEVLTEMGGAPPNSRHATLAMMHKIRAQWRFRRSFTDGERRISKRWLKEHGYNQLLVDEKLDEVQSED